MCTKELVGKQSMYCSIKCKNYVHQSYEAQKKRGLTRRLDFVQRLGGKCTKCGYSTNLAALSFHHLRDKSFQLDARAFSNRKIEPILAEIDKCILLCNNCHAEIHNPSLDLAKLLIEPTALTTELHPRVGS